MFGGPCIRGEGAQAKIYNKVIHQLDETHTMPALMDSVGKKKTNWGAIAKRPLAVWEK